MTATLTFVIVIIFIALIYDYRTGSRAPATSIAPVVSARVLSPGVAVAWAAFFNFIAFLIYGTRVAKNIGDGIHMDKIATDDRLYVLLAALIGAIAWNITTWYLGLPTSSSHALLGGYAGAGMAAFGGVSGLLNVEVWEKTVIFIVLSPLIGLVLGFSLMIVIYWRSEEHTSELQSHSFISYAVFCLKKKTTTEMQCISMRTTKGRSTLGRRRPV